MGNKDKPGTWIILANSARAILVEDRGADSALIVVHVFRNPAGRMNAAGLVTDQPSRAQSPTGTGTSLAPRTDPHRNARDHFAAELAKLLAESQRRGEFSKLVVAASNPFFGILLHHLHPHVKKVVARTIERDFINVPLNRLRERLAEA